MNSEHKRLSYTQVNERIRDNLYWEIDFSKTFQPAMEELDVLIHETLIDILYMEAIYLNPVN